MNKIVIGVIVVVFLGGGFFAVSSLQKQEKMEMEQKAMMEKEAMEMEKKEMEQKTMIEKEAMEKGSMMEKGDEMNIDGEMMKEEDTMMKEDDVQMMMKEDDVQMMMKEDEAMMAKGSYEAYSASKLAMAEKGDVVLFFKASWCPSCKALDADIKANVGSINEDLTILEVNYDTETALKQKYGVTTQHTLVQVDKDGTLITKWSGGNTLASLEAKVQ